MEETWNALSAQYLEVKKRNQETIGSIFVLPQDSGL